VLVQQVVKQLQQWGGKTVQENPGREENVVFAIPAELR
jgi:4-hydroxy-3-methylbut-2-en-1-yl diphosphate reductase